MPNELLPTNGSFSEWIEAIELSDLIEGVGEISKESKYFKMVVGAYKWFRTKRAEHFIKSLTAASIDLTQEQRKLFDDILKSNEGAELLSEFTDAILRTASRTAIAALAILYADATIKRYSSSFKLAAAIALEGISESHIDAFIDLSQVTLFVPSNNQPDTPYPVVVANDQVIHSLPPHTRELLSPPETRVALVRDLISRGLLLPDYALSRWGEGGVGVTYGISEATHKYRELFIKARTLLPCS